MVRTNMDMAYLVPGMVLEITDPLITMMSWVLGNDQILTTNNTKPHSHHSHAFHGTQLATTMTKEWKRGPNDD